MNVLVFAYGSNLNLAQFERRCPNWRFFARASLEGHVLEFRGASSTWGGAVASVRPCANGVVHGVIYRIPIDDLIRLDAFEGAPNVYRRVQVVCKISSGGRVQAHTYTHRSAVPALPSRRYLDVIREAYRSWGITRHSLRHALRRSA